MDQASGSFNKARVSILGRQYTLKGDVDADYMAMLAHKLDERIEEMRKASPNMDTIQVLILVALNLADELERSEQENNQNRATQMDEIGDKTKSLIGMLEKGIVGD